MNRKTFAYLLYSSAIVSFVILFIGFILAVWDLTHPSKSSALAAKKQIPTPQAQEGLFVGLGDSLTRGVGDSKGLGYFGLVREQLAKKNPGRISAVNLAINGQTSTDLVKQIQQEKVRILIAKARWITITIGGNDLFRGSGGLEKLDLKAAKKSREIYEKNLTTLFTEIRKLNSKATVFLFGLYNPFGDLADEKISSQLVAEWNETMQKVSARFNQIVVIPTFDLFQLEPGKYLYSDHFHPNDAGYQRMATRLLQVLEDTEEGEESHDQ
ncbi:SGNH/GDSL hydrolase family protein [Thermoflavimicrobium dichotomicum]|uniref:Lysophospholipase L1 n=1 Tax=Thermoflavimicrobium dichotomicum TaxID=46223 RepID=A0A1I3R620_9BACL|nr:SGNH/GDSL hydrolase family protein [Thermoflavimicrobium dichotomicum]SFJ41500.1 Lysophospholipase L1 [Thermoflavimicrobium dichotomicum]